jgi:uncharacterized repeat protein (TIGR02543 family)
MAGLSFQIKKYFLMAFSTAIVLYFLGISNAHSAQVTLAWDPNTEPTLAGYKVHYGTASGSYQTHIDAGLTTTYTVTNLQDGGTYYFAVTAYDSSANQSGYSAEVFYAASSVCTYAISPTTQSLSSSGGAGTVSVTASSGCTWTAVSNSSWAIITSNSSGTASGTVNYSVSPNSATASRIGSMTIAGKTLTLNQAGLSCSYAISPTSQSFDFNGGSGTIAVTTPSGCAWNASSNAGWISVISGSSGSGNGSINFSVAVNSSVSSRTGTVTVGGQTFTVAQNSAPQYTLSVTKNGTGTGSMVNTPAGNIFSSGTVVTLTATPDVSSTFAGWSGACTGTSLTCSVTMSSNLSATATFNLKTYTITANAGANGSISPQGVVNVNYGASQGFTISPNAGYQVADVKVNGISVGAVTSYGFANVTSNQTIQASFGTLGSCALTLTQAGTGVGSVSTSPTSTSFSPGTSVTLTAYPDGSSIFTGWSGACSGTSPTCIITMDSNKSVTANFTRKSYIITSTAGTNGSITPSGSTSVNYGGSKSFVITPARGYKIKDVKVDGVSIGNPNNYSFGNVRADHTIGVSFIRNRNR